MTYSNGDTTYSVAYMIDTRHKPHHLTVTVVDRDGQTRAVNFIYRIDGDTLETARCVSYLNGGRRPESFDADGIYIATWKRVGK
jgi:uncharacterized protein (TIGR03067 family)